jgi:hypothetical protein
MNRPEGSTPFLQKHHIVAAIVAIVVAIALALNYYLW